MDKNAQMITAMFNLTEQDIYNFRFYDKIQVDGQYYNVQSINDWNPDVLTEVVLVKQKTSELPVTAAEKTADIEKTLEYNDIRYSRRMRTSDDSDNTQVQRTNTRRSFVTATPETRQMSEAGDLTNPLLSGQTWNDLSGTTAITTTVTGTTSVEPTIITDDSRGYATGVDNYISSMHFMLVGNSNNFSGTSYNTMTVGDNNTYLDNSRNVTILGSNNTVGSNIDGSTIIGDNITLNTSDTLVLGNQTILSKTPIEPIVNIISAPNLDAKQINPFNRLKPIQVLSGGDMAQGVRPLRSENTTFVVDSRTSPTTNYTSYAQVIYDASGNTITS
jgi:hypothetical protein